MRKRTILIVLIVLVSSAILPVLLNWVTVRNTLVRALKTQLRKDFLSELNEIKTKESVKTESKLVFSIVTDVHNNTNGLSRAIKEINNSEVKFVIGLGDYTNIGTEEEFTPIKSSLRSLKKPYYLLPGDHDLWNGRDKREEPEYFFHKSFPKVPTNFINNGTQFLFLDNADLYTGVPENELNNFIEDIEKTTEPLILIFSHRAIYHPLTNHRMGYINEEKNEEVSNQANQIINTIKNKKNSKITLFSGDLHAFSKYSLPSDSYEAYSIGALTETKNFQNPRYGIVRISTDNNITVEDVPLRE